MFSLHIHIFIILLGRGNILLSIGYVWYEYVRTRQT